MVSLGVGRAAGIRPGMTHPTRFSTCADRMPPLPPVSNTQPHAVEDLKSSRSASWWGKGTTMVSVGVATSVCWAPGRSRPTSSIGRAPGWDVMACRRILYSWYTFQRIWYALILTPGKTIIDALKTRTFIINLF